MNTATTRAPDGLRPFMVTHPRRIPASRYYSPEFFEMERRHLWPRVWQMACRLEEIQDVGDWVEYRILDKSVIVVRTPDGVKAFHNSCRHRGVQLASGHGNCAANGFICPFHGWRWNMDGENTFVFGRGKFAEEDLDQADIALVPCRVEFWAGCAFINFDDDAVPLLESLGPVAERMTARAADKLKMEWWVSAILPVNWKLAMEAFMEGYHVMATHPQLHRMSAPESNMYGVDGPDSPPLPKASASPREYVEVSVEHMARLRAGMAGMIDGFELEIAESLRTMDLPESIPEAIGAYYTRLRSEITRQGRERGLPIPDLNELAVKYPFKAVEFMFPHYFLLPMHSGMSSYRIRPLTEETCLFELWSLAHLPDDPDREVPTAPVPMPHDDPRFPEIPRQDYSNLPLQQLGLHAHGFEFMRLSPQVEGLISNYQRLIDGYIAGLDKNLLARGSGVTNAGLDTPLADIGFVLD